MKIAYYFYNEKLKNNLCQILIINGRKKQRNGKKQDP